MLVQEDRPDNQIERALAGEEAMIQDKLRALQQSRGHMDVSHDVLADHRIKHYAYQKLEVMKTVLTYPKAVICIQYLLVSVPVRPDLYLHIQSFPPMSQHISCHQFVP